MENEKLAQWQSADSLRRLLNTTGSTVVYFWRENKKIEGRYKIERRKNSDDNRLQYRAIDTDTDSE